jgi:hypothetical protein
MGLDLTDIAILFRRVAAREATDGPRLGDYVLFPGGQLERFSHDWGDSIQTAPGGSFFIYRSGEAEFSGGLNPSIPVDKLELTEATLPGSFWFFHHDEPGAGRGVNCTIDCRVYKTSAPYQGFLGKDFQSAEIDALKGELALRLQAA